MASKAYKLRLDNVADVPFNEDDLNVHGTEYEQGRQHDSKKQRFVDRTRLLAHVKVKVERSQKGRTAVLFIIFTTIYMSAIVLQRNCRDTQGLVAGMGKYLTSATFRDPGTFELKTFHDLANMDDVWMWHYYVLAPKIYTSHYYNGIKQEGKDRGSILTFNRLTTGFRMVQRRALNGTGTFCIARPKYQDFTKNCYGRTFIDSRLGDVEKLPFYSFDLRNKYEYKEEKAQGALDANVGYFEEFGIDRDSPLETARTRLRLLQNDMWINPGTAWLRTDFATYNPNLGLFCFVKFTFEFLPTGEMRSTYVANTMKGKLYQTPGDMTILALEGLAVLFWIIFVVRMWSHFVLEWRTKHRVLAYFDDFDHSLEFVQNFMFVAIVAMRFLIVTYPIRDTFAITEEDITVSAVECTGKLACSGNWWEPRAGFEPVKVAKRQMFHDSLGFLEDQYFNLNGVNAVFCLVRILSYLRINPNISQLTDTFMRCRSNMTQFAIVLFVLVLMFDIMAVFMFGAKLPEFNNIAIGFITTARFMLGSGDILALMEADKIAAPIFYYPFTFIMVFVVLNMTIAIIMDGYMDIQMEKKENLQVCAAFAGWLLSNAYVEWAVLWEGQLRIVHTLVARFVFGASFCISILVLNFFASVLLDAMDAMFLLYAIDRDHRTIMPRGEELHAFLSQQQVGRPISGVKYTPRGWTFVHSMPATARSQRDSSHHADYGGVGAISVGKPEGVQEI